jgi:hypothetical protein
MKFFRDALEGLKAFGKRETWHQLGKGIGMFADGDKRQKIFQQAKEGLDDVKAGKHGEALGSFVKLASKTPVGVAANEALDGLATGDYGKALNAARSQIKSG